MEVGVKLSSATAEMQRTHKNILQTLVKQGSCQVQRVDFSQLIAWMINICVWAFV